MTTITIEVPEERLQQLKQRAAELGMTVEDLMQLSIAEVLSRPGDELQQAMDYVLQKNAELYRRLA